MAHAIKDPRLNSQRSILWLANQIMWPCEWAYIVINRWLLLLLLDYSLALFSVSAGEFVLRLMAGEQKIKTPSARDAPADNKGCEFARSSFVCSCVYATWLCYSFSSFELSISTVFGLFLTVGTVREPGFMQRLESSNWSCFNGCTLFRCRGVEHNVLWISTLSG